MKLLLPVFIFLSQVAFSQSAEEVIKMHRDAIGVTQNPIKSYKFDGAFYLMNADKLLYNCIVYFKAPDRWRIDVIGSAIYEASSTFVQGDSAWHVNQKGLINYNTKGVFASDLLMFTWPDYLCYTDVLVCEKKYAGLSAKTNRHQFWVNVLKGGYNTCKRTFTIDTTSVNITSIFEYNNYKEGKPDYTVSFSDQKTLNGISYPSKMKKVYYGTNAFFSSLEKKNVEINIPLEDKFFDANAFAAEKKAYLKGNLGEIISQNKYEQAIAMINAGADVNSYTNSYQGYTPISWATKEGSMELTKLLLEKGADVNYKGDISGYTPLHNAVHQANTELIVFLLSKGADINLKNSFGETPLKLASAMKNTEIVKLLKERGATK